MLLAVALLLLFTTEAAMANNEIINGNITDGGWVRAGNNSWTFSAFVELNEPLHNYLGNWTVTVIAEIIYDYNGKMYNNVQITKTGNLVPADNSTTKFKVSWNKGLPPNWDDPSGIISPVNISLQQVKVNVIH